ncbi:MAG: phosphoethanolamine--lipid A transferase [Burkholderiaceae bacterium]
MRKPTPLPSLSTARPPARAVNPLALAAGASLWIASFANWPLWQALLRLPEMASVRGALFIAGFAAMLALLLLALLAQLAFARSVKPAIAVCLISSAIGAHFMGSYGVVIDTTMLTNVLQTNVAEVRDLLSLGLLASVLVLAGLPLLAMAWLPVNRLQFHSQLWRNALAMALSLLAIVLLVLASFADLAATMRNHKQIRFLINPLNSFYALGVLGYQANARPAGPPLPIGLDARILPRNGRPPLLVLVIGETARADHFSLNGYARTTNPELARHDVLSAPNVTSCGTSTAASLPCMLSHLGRDAFESREHESENLLDVVQRAGLAVLWLDNQAGCKGVCARVPNAFAHQAAPGAAALPAEMCSDGECLDEALLHGLDARLLAMPAEQRERGVFLVLHQMGSHGPAYSKRSPAALKTFQPECTTVVLQQCSSESLVNAYDNSILYTDRVLAATIVWLQQRVTEFDVAMIYVSDHGESLGENNLYLHGLPYAFAPREQTHVPWLTWFAPSAQQSLGLNWQCLRERLTQPLSHDHLFHSVIGALQIHASEYRPALDAFAACRSP